MGSFVMTAWNLMYLFFFAVGISKGKIAYVPLEPFADYVHILDLNTRLCIVWKKLSNLNFKPKFQTQILKSKFKLKLELQKLKSSPSSWVIRDSEKLTPRVKGIKATKE